MGDVTILQDTKAVAFPVDEFFLLKVCMLSAGLTRYLGVITSSLHVK